MECEYCYALPKVLDESGAVVAARNGIAAQRPFQLPASESGLSPDALEYWANRFTVKGELDSIPPAQFDSAGGMPVRSFRVDHSIYGASAFAVETQDGWIVYTGDLRAHGKNGQLTWDFAEAAMSCPGASGVT